MSNNVLRSSGIHPEILAKFKEIFPEHGDIEEYLHRFTTRNIVSVSTPTTMDDSSSVARRNNTASLEQDQIDEALTLSTVLALTSNTTPVSVPGINSSRNVLPHSSGIGNTDSEMSAAIALSLGELRAESTIPVAESQGETLVPSSHPAATPENVDTENMTYEELQSLTDALGTESRGLSKELIAKFPTQILDGKSTWFSSKKSKPEECAICLMEYETGDEVLTLPCLHLYHNPCITQWLTENKTCPVCSMDVSAAATMNLETLRA